MGGTCGLCGEDGVGVDPLVHVELGLLEFGGESEIDALYPTRRPFNQKSRDGLARIYLILRSPVLCSLLVRRDDFPASFH